MIGYHLSLMTAIRNTGTDFWRRGGGEKTRNIIPGGLKKTSRKSLKKL